METKYLHTQKNFLLLFIVFLTLLILPLRAAAQFNNMPHPKITPTAIENYRIGLNSGNEGIVKSCIYFAGKYRMNDVCSDLLSIIEKSDDVELCRLILWSLYQIGNDKYCDMLQKIVHNHKSEEVRDFYNFLNQIRRYGNEIAVNN